MQLLRFFLRYSIGVIPYHPSTDGRLIKLKQRILDQIDILRIPHSSTSQIHTSSSRDMSEKASKNHRRVISRDGIPVRPDSSSSSPQNGNHDTTPPAAALDKATPYEEERRSGLLFAMQSHSWQERALSAEPVSARRAVRRRKRSVAQLPPNEGRRSWGIYNVERNADSSFNVSPSDEGVLVQFLRDEVVDQRRDETSESQLEEQVAQDDGIEVEEMPGLDSQLQAALAAMDSDQGRSDQEAPSLPWTSNLSVRLREEDNCEATLVKEHTRNMDKCNNP